jgi:hypothetical protein
MIPKAKRTKGAHGPSAVYPNACKPEQTENAETPEKLAWSTWSDWISNRSKPRQSH